MGGGDTRTVEAWRQHGVAYVMAAGRTTMLVTAGTTTYLLSSGNAYAPPSLLLFLSAAVTFLPW